MEILIVPGRVDIAFARYTKIQDFRTNLPSLTTRVISLGTKEKSVTFDSARFIAALDREKFLSNRKRDSYVTA